MYQNNYRDYLRLTGGLHHWTFDGIIAILQNLFPAGQNPICDVNASNREGFTTLMLSARRGFLDGVNFLINHNAAVNLTDLQGATALHYAARQHENTDHIANPNYDGVINALVRAGANINAQDNRGNTPLMIAAQYGHIEVVRALMHAGANCTIRNQNGQTASDLAANNQAILETIRAYNQNKLRTFLIGTYRRNGRAANGSPVSMLSVDVLNMIAAQVMAPTPPAMR